MKLAEVPASILVEPSGLNHLPEASDREAGMHIPNPHHPHPVVGCGLAAAVLGSLRSEQDNGHDIIWATSFSPFAESSM